MVMNVPTQDSFEGSLPGNYAEHYRNELDQAKAAACWRLFQRSTAGMRPLSVLDLGCGDGTFLDLAAREGLSTAGVEISSLSALKAERSGHRIWLGSITDPSLELDGSYDVVTMWDVLEHLSNPLLALRLARDILKPEGRLIVLTPMMGSLYDRLGLRLCVATNGQLDQLARMCWSENHLFRFDPEGLATTLESLGFNETQAASVFLLSLAPDRYAGGEIFHRWTGSPRVNRALSRAGVLAGRLFRRPNKVLVVGTRRKVIGL